MEELKLKARKRKGKGTGYCKKIRREGWIPAVLYGRGMDSILLEVDKLEFNQLAKQAGYTSLINLSLDDDGEEKYLALIKDSTKDVFHKGYIHIDFYQVRLDEKVTAKVPVQLEGEAPGAREGGQLDQVLWEVEVEAFPLDLPDHLNLDIGELKIDEALYVKDIIHDDKVSILTDKDEVVVIIHPPRKIEEVAPAEEAEEAVTPAAIEPAPAEPELISSKPEEEG
ncbi:MAG: 50S ribosomal protein L25 [Candidatus Eremiobacteraeota bacterium]|nr:50S ribosomal protein L25 [Candidatus Eremiobacteraeota bacterium]